MTNSSPVEVKRKDDSDKSGLTTTEGKSRQRSWIFVGVFIIAALVVASVLFLPRGSFRKAPQQPATSQSAEVRPTPDLRARKLLGTPPSGGQWFSGAWAGGDHASTKRVVAFGSWRDTPTDAATVYTEIGTWQAVYDSNWHITTFKGLMEFFPLACRYSRRRREATSQQWCKESTTEYIKIWPGI